ncbi:MAG: hypothetical protein HY854_16425 [Burkholderiales bacterium]|nr:hypothetical protein [Burkholderiales bacterium]
MTPLARIHRRRVELRLEIALMRARLAVSPAWRATGAGGLLVLAWRWWRSRLTRRGTAP